MTPPFVLPGDPRGSMPAPYRPLHNDQSGPGAEERLGHRGELAAEGLAGERLTL